MIGQPRSFSRCAVLRTLILVALTCTAASSGAAPHPDIHDDDSDRPDGIHVLDGSYVIDAGVFQVNITNHGLIGSHFTDFTTYSSAPSAQWPGGSGDEYLYGAGLWIGAKVGGDISVTTGQPVRELRPTADIEDTIYEAKRGVQVRPNPSTDVTGRRLPDPRADDDKDNLRDEDILNGRDDDGDGRIDEDFAQIGAQMMVATMHDDTPLVREMYPEHLPLGVTVIQRAASWTDPEFDDFVALDFEIRNTGFEELRDLYLGFYVDCDIQNRANIDTQPDDLSGFFNGIARDGNGVFHRLQVAWMKDAAEKNPLPGVFGLLTIDHTTDFAGLRAPGGLGVTTYRTFSTGASFNQGGEPLSDADRYALMAGTRFDRNILDHEADDYRFVVATGPFRIVEAGTVLNYRLAMVIGNGMEDMLKAALRASQVQRGSWFDGDDNWTTGNGGKETKVCFGDLPNAYGTKPLEQYRAAFMDERCIGPEPVFGQPTIQYDETFVDEDGRTCIWVNADNCEECFSIHGRECTVENGLFWDSPPPLYPWWQPSYYTGTYGREHREPWVFVGEAPPFTPNMRVVPGDREVEIFWDNLSEFIPDDTTGAFDFEAYRIWRIVNWTRPTGVDEHQTPPVELWGMIDEWDIINTIPAGTIANTVDVPMGRNTGLTGIRYTPACLSDPAYEGLAEAMTEIVLADTRGRYIELPPLRLADGTPRGGFETLLPWESSEAVLDTFFAVTRRPGTVTTVPKRATGYYHHIDKDLHNNFRMYYAVTALDHTPIWDGTRWVPTGYGAESSPAEGFVVTTPRQAAQTVADRAAYGTNIFVYPNPVTREALADFDQQATTWDNPTGSQVVWANLPAAHNTIKIFTTSGDLIETIHHDGTGGDGAAGWNLVSRNGQEVVSGIYLYVVQSDDGFEDFVGRFVVIR